MGERALNRYTGEVANCGKYSLRFAGEVVEITKEATEPFDRTHEPIFDPMDWRTAPGAVPRGVVREFSQRSRRRLAKACAAIAWGAQPFYFVTVTYPNEWPTDGRRVKADLNQLRTEWTRRWGLPLAVWKLEFQRRGAPHFHLAIAEPLQPVPFAVMAKWLSETWYRIVGSGDPRHLRAGTQIEPMIQPPTAYFSSHGEHGRDKKGYQNEVPEDYEDVGRFWGFWNLAPEWVERELDLDEYIQARRMMRAWSRANGGPRWRDMRPLQPMWLRTRRRPSMHFATQLLRAIELCT